jgi:hypothetical protein
MSLYQSKKQVSIRTPGRCLHIPINHSGGLIVEKLTPDTYRSRGRHV